jgi:hypothetical protein
VDENEHTVHRIWSMRQINTVVFYLIQWEDDSSLTWEPRANVPWQLVAEFERTNVNTIWDFQSTRGRRRSLPRERPTRVSQRLRGMIAFLCFRELT